MSEWDNLKEKMDKILVDMSDIGFAVEFSKIWNQIETEGDKLQEKADKWDLISKYLGGECVAYAIVKTKLDAIKHIMETMCEDVDCDLFNEDKAEWCDKCPIFKLEKILEN